MEAETTQTKTQSTTSNQKGIMGAMRIVAEHPEGSRTTEGNDEEQGYEETYISSAW